MSQQVADVAGSADFVDAMNTFHRARIRPETLFRGYFLLARVKNDASKGLRLALDLAEALEGHEKYSGLSPDEYTLDFLQVAFSRRDVADHI